MLNTEMLLLVFVFVAVFGVVFLLLKSGFSQSKTAQRTRAVIGNSNGSLSSSGDKNMVNHFVRMMEPVGKLSIPEEGWENSPLQLKFVNAGLRSKEQQKLFFAVKTLLAFGLPLFVVFALNIGLIDAQGNDAIFKIFLAAAIGLYSPNIYLQKKIESRQLQIIHALPDALDLLLICMSAGLSFDNALIKVSKETALNSPLLSEEFEIYLLEVRTGYTRERALRNLAMRTGLDAVDMLATTVIQSEKFGTSLVEAMRIYSSTFRTKRRQKAEEEAGKVALKLLFPLLTCLMPATMIVLLVPSMMQLAKLFGE